MMDGGHIGSNKELGLEREWGNIYSSTDREIFEDPDVTEARRPKREEGMGHRCSCLV